MWAQIKINFISKFLQSWSNVGRKTLLLKGKKINEWKSHDYIFSTFMSTHWYGWVSTTGCILKSGNLELNWRLIFGRFNISIHPVWNLSVSFKETQFFLVSKSSSSYWSWYDLRQMYLWFFKHDIVFIANQSWKWSISSIIIIFFIIF